jgi:hypothetical protein
MRLVISDFLTDHLLSVLDDCLLSFPFFKIFYVIADLLHTVFIIPLPPLLVSAIPAKNRGDVWVACCRKKNFVSSFFV